MTVRDVYIFEGLRRVPSEDDCEDAQAEVIDDVCYARQLRRSPMIADRSIRRAARERRAAAMVDREIVDRELVDDTDEPAADQTIMAGAAFGGMGGLGAALTVIGLLILAAAWSGPSWGWGGARSMAQGPDAYGFAQTPNFTYADDGYSAGPYPRYAPSSFGTDPLPFVDPSRAMVAGGMLLLAGLALMATRRRSFLR